MLPGLDQIDWSRMSHAYGPATDIPQLLRSLADPSESVREEAMMELCNSINHQGSIYEATAAVVPFLFELLALDPAIPDRAMVVNILGGVSEGWNAEVRARSDDRSTAPPRFRESTERLALERPYRQAAHRAVENEFATLRELLHDAEIAVRVAALFVVSTLMDRREEAALALQEVIDQDAHDWCRAEAILALLELVRQQSPDRVTEAAIRRFREIGADDLSGPDARLCAGIALLHLGDAEGLTRTLTLARPRLAGDRRHFYPLPSGAFSRNLFGLVADSLKGWPEPRVSWIKEGLEHGEPEVVSSALSEAGWLCREVRWGPSRVASSITKLADAKDAKTRLLAIGELRDLGNAGLDELIRLTHHSKKSVRTQAADWIERYRAHERSRQTKWIDPRPSVLAPVAELVQTIERHQGSRNWQDVEEVCNALRQLGFHGPNAADSVDLIREQIVMANTRIATNTLAASQLRLTAIRSLWKITHDAEPLVPHLIASLEPSPHGFLVIEQLREIGPLARDALPALRKIIDSERRFTDDGDCSGCCPDDEAYQVFAANAIRDIESEPSRH